MPLWVPSDKEIDPRTIGTFVPSEVIFDFEGPRTFTCRSVDGGLLLAHQCDEEDGEARFIVVPTDERIVGRLQTGKMGVRSVLENAGRVSIVDLKHDWTPLRAFRVTFQDIPGDCLPSATAALRPAASQETALSVRLVGPQIGERLTPASVVKAAASSAYSALKRIVDHLSSDPKWIGPTADWWRQFYDLPALGFRSASFEIEFGWPQEAKTSTGPTPERGRHGEIVREISRMLAAGIQWCSNPDAQGLPGIDRNESRAILEAIELLSPPQTGSYIEQVQVKGEMAGARQPVRLTKATRKQIKGRLESEKSAGVWFLWARGKVDALDRGLQRLTLRGVDLLRFSAEPDRALVESLFREVVFEYGDEWSEPVEEAFDSGERAFAYGRVRTQNLYTLLGFASYVPAEEVDQSSNGSPRD